MALFASYYAETVKSLNDKVVNFTIIPTISLHTVCAFRLNSNPTQSHNERILFLLHSEWLIFTRQKTTPIVSSIPGMTDLPEPTPHSYVFPILVSIVFISLCISTFDERAQEWHPRFWLSISGRGNTLSHKDPNKSGERKNPRNSAKFYNLFPFESYLFPNPNGTFSMEGNLTTAANTEKKLILLWSETSRQTRGAHIFADCPENRCAITTNTEAYYNRSAAVLFFAGAPDDSGRPGPTRAFSSQFFVFVLGESPKNAVPTGFMKDENFFNWTMTYRLDSDIRAHYTYKVPLEKKRRNFAAGKTKLVAWIVSHCNTSSERERYITELGTFIPVDIYGKCGNLSCGNHSECMGNIRNYKFYLSFENRCTQLMKKLEVWNFFSIMNFFFTRISRVGHDYSMSWKKGSTAIFK